MSKLYVISDGEVVYSSNPDDQESDNNPAPIISLAAAKKALAAVEREQNVEDSDDGPSPFNIYVLKKVD
jgi:hypothetical protein